MRAKRPAPETRGHRGRFAHRDRRGHCGQRGRCGHRNRLAHRRRRERRDRNKRQRRGNPRRNTKISSGRFSRHAVLHRQARRFGHRSERCASTSCAPTTDRGVRRQHRQPRGLTPVFGEIPLQNRRKDSRKGVRSASAYPSYRGIGKESVRASRNASGNGLQFHACPFERLKCDPRRSELLSITVTREGRFSF